MITRFPNPELSTPEGIVAVGGDLSTEVLQDAYTHGIFPWPLDEKTPLVWFCPVKRGILEWEHLHIPRSLKRSERRLGLRFSINQAFPAVIEACRTRRVKTGTWITPAILEAYQRLHQEGHAQSFEAWKEDRLVAGLYGVSLGGYFAGESMFTTLPDASKLVLLYAMNYLHARGLDWMDTQMTTPHLESLGGREISRTEFLERIQKTQRLQLELFPG